MATLREITYDILNTIRAGITSDDDNLSPRHIEFMIHNTRAKMIRDDLNKGRSLSQNVIQSLGCLDVSPVSATECCGVEIDCDVYRTDVQLPEPVELSQQDLITKVGSIIIGSKPFDVIPIDRVPYLGHTPFKGINEQIYASIHNRYVYLFQKKRRKRLIKKIAVWGIWANPIDAAEFNECSGTPCYTADSQYPVSSHMIEAIKRSILENSLKIAANAPTDQTGNAKSDVQSNLEK